MKKGIVSALLPAAFLFSALVLSSAHADEIHSWVDADGVTHFGDKNAAPKNSKPVELKPGTYLKVVPAPPAAPVEQKAEVNTPPRAVAKRPCTPVMQEVVDPKTGMHSQRESGRCEEDGPVTADDDSYPYYNWGYAPPPYPRPPYPPRPRPPRPDNDLPRPSLPSRPAGPGGGGGTFIPF